jgi:hypothetical protein
MADDVSNLLGAVSPVSGASNPVIVAAPNQARALQTSARLNLNNFTVLPTTALADGIVIAPRALVTAIDPQIRFKRSGDSVIHLDDAPSSDLVNAGGTPATGGAVRSMFQSDSFATQAICQVGWGLRSQSALAWTTTTKW